MTQGLIDIHQHIVYQMDDGPRKWGETEAMLAKAAEQGIQRIIATPHAFPGRAHFDYDGYLDRLNEINRFAWEKGWDVQLLPGAEIYYTPHTLQKLDAQAIPTLVMSRYVLVEFEPEVRASELLKAMRELANGGYQPILAHVERYECIQLKPELLEELRYLGVLIQMNAQTVLHSNGLFGGKRYLRWLLKEDLVDFVATDAHNMSSRPVCLREAYAFLEKNYGKEKADRLLWRNQLEILPILNGGNDLM